MKIAAAYIRVSTDDQIEFSPDSQLEKIREYAARNNLLQPDEYLFLDEGISGRSTGKREAFNKMISLAKSNPKPFDVILVWKYSRFARNREDSVVYKSMLRKQCHIDVISISEPVGDDKMSILFESMIEAMDEYYSINLAEEVRRGMTEKAKRGGVLSVPPYGYEIKDGEYSIVESEAEIVRNAFISYANGEGFLSIAKKLNSMGVRTRRGKLIENRTIDYWLNNPTYIGKTRWNPKGHLGRNFNSDTVIISRSNHPPIIDNETWDIVQERIAAVKEKHRKYMRDASDGISHWLTGVLRCGKCGSTLVNCGGFFYCSKKLKGICKGTGGVSVNKISEIITDKLKEILECDDMMFELSVQPEEKKMLSSEKIIKNKIKDEKTRLQRVKTAYEEGADTIDEYKENKNRIGKELKRLENLLSEKSAEYNSENTSDENQHAFNIFKVSTGDFTRILEDPDIDCTVKNKMIKSIIREVIKTDDKETQYRIIFWQK